MANPLKTVGNILDTASSAVLSKVGAGLGSAVGPVGTVVGHGVGAVAGKLLKYLLMAVVAAVVLVAVAFLAIIITVIFGLSGSSGDTVHAEPLPCSVLSSTFNNPEIIDRVNGNISIYKTAADSMDIPWEMLAAIHYAESGNDPNAPNMYQFDPPPPQVDVNDFVAATGLAAQVLQGKAATGSVGRPLRKNMNPNKPNDEESIKDAFWGYNGRAAYQREIAASLGFDPATQGYEGSGYVMNRWDLGRESMLIRIYDEEGNVIEEVSHQIDGTWKVFVLLRNATYEGGVITQINDSCEGGEGDENTPSGCPLVGTITTPYGFNIPGYVSSRFHAAIDINDGPGNGTPVHTTISGLASPAGSSGAGGGYSVIVTNEEYSVGFYHLESGGRVSGQVTKGKVVGKKDNSGTETTGSHLHYTIYKGAVRQNPLSYITATLNFTLPVDNDYIGIAPTGGVWGRCTALP
jgi:murein DD-endopeptidase MepM/ murein hydrolase activator NlpD